MAYIDAPEVRLQDGRFSVDFYNGVSPSPCCLTFMDENGNEMVNIWLSRSEINRARLIAHIFNEIANPPIAGNTADNARQDTGSSSSPSDLVLPGTK